MGGGGVAQAVTRAAPGEIDRLILLAPLAGHRAEHLRGGPWLFSASHDEPMSAEVTEHYRRAPEPERLVLHRAARTRSTSS